MERNKGKEAFVLKGLFQFIIIIKKFDYIYNDDT